MALATLLDGSAILQSIAWRHRGANPVHGTGELLIDRRSLNPRKDIRLYRNGRQPVPAPYHRFLEPVGKVGNLRKRRGAAVGQPNLQIAKRPEIPAILIHGTPTHVDQIDVVAQLCDRPS